MHVGPSTSNSRSDTDTVTIPSKRKAAQLWQERTASALHQPWNRSTAVPTVATPCPRTEAEAVAATRKRWALDLLAHAAGEHHKTANALTQLTTRAREHGCSAQDIAEILGGYR